MQAQTTKPKQRPKSAEAQQATTDLGAAIAGLLQRDISGLSTEDLKGLAAQIAALKSAPDANIDALVRKASESVAAHQQGLAALDEKLKEIDAIIGLTVRDERAAAGEQHLQQVHTARTALLEAEQERLTAIADAEGATRALVDALKRAIAANAIIVRRARDLAPEGSRWSAPEAISQSGLISRLSIRVAAIIASIGKGPQYAFGCLSWSANVIGNERYRAGTDWRAVEEALVQRQVIAPLLKGTEQ